MLGCNYPNDDNQLKTSILSHPPNTQCPPKGSLASCTIISRFPHMVLPWAMVPAGRYSLYLRQANKATVKGDGYATVSREEPNNQKKNPRHLPQEAFLFFLQISNFEKSVPVETKEHTRQSGLSKSDLCTGHSPLPHENEFMSTNECAWRFCHFTVY